MKNEMEGEPGSLALGRMMGRWEGESWDCFGVMQCWSAGGR